MLPRGARRAVDRYLRLADRLLPDRIVGLYVVGSTALGAFREDRSDIDVVAVVDRSLDRAELRRLRMLHVAAGASTGLRALARGHIEMPVTVNGVYVRAADLSRPVTEIVPVAGQAGPQFTVGEAFDVNPVTWTVFDRHGIVVRGAPVATLGLRPEPERLRAWNLANLDAYWRGWGDAAVRGRARSGVTRVHRVAWGALGAPRLHYTIATGNVISKEAAGEYAREAFDARWHRAIDVALAYWRGAAPRVPRGERDALVRDTGAFVLDVVRSAHTLVSASG